MLCCGSVGQLVRACAEEVGRKGVSRSASEPVSVGMLEGTVASTLKRMECMHSMNVRTPDGLLHLDFLLHETLECAPPTAVYACAMHARHACLPRVQAGVPQISVESVYSARRARPSHEVCLGVQPVKTP